MFVRSGVSPIVTFVLFVVNLGLLAVLAIGIAALASPSTFPSISTGSAIAMIVVPVGVFIASAITVSMMSRARTETIASEPSVPAASAVPVRPTAPVVPGTYQNAAPLY